MPRRVDELDELNHQIRLGEVMAKAVTKPKKLTRLWDGLWVVIGGKIPARIVAHNEVYGVFLVGDKQITVRRRDIQGHFTYLREAVTNAV